MPHLFQCHLALIPPLYVLSVLPGVSLLQIQPRDLPVSNSLVHSVHCLQRAKMLLTILLLNLVLCLADAKSSPKEDLEGGVENLERRCQSGVLSLSGNFSPGDFWGDIAVCRSCTRVA